MIIVWRIYTAKKVRVLGRTYECPFNIIVLKFFNKNCSFIFLSLIIVIFFYSIGQTLVYSPLESKLVHEGLFFRACILLINCMSPLLLRRKTKWSYFFGRYIMWSAGITIMALSFWIRAYRLYQTLNFINHTYIYFLFFLTLLKTFFFLPFIVFFLPNH